jgi:osmotically-inducible protein OsmY
LQRDVENALFMEPTLHRNRVAVQVSSGLVTLKGTVDTWLERELAERYGGGVRGVAGVHNELILVIWATREPAEISAEIESNVANDADAAPSDFRVSVEGRRVVLSGTVRSAQSRRRVEALARVAAVDEIDNRLEVRWWAGTNQSAKANIASVAQRALAADPRCKEAGLDVTAEASVVIVRGTVPTLHASQACQETAENVTGVTSVRNDIKVAPIPPLTDEAQSDRIRQMLEADADLSDYAIVVNVRNGVATLTGVVDFYADKVLAVETVSRTGVRGIDDALTVNPGNRLRGDREIEDKIESRLMWNPDVNAERVEVEVTEGVAVLKGELVSRRAIASTIRSAYEAGAYRVSSELRLAGPAGDGRQVPSRP